MALTTTLTTATHHSTAGRFGGAPLRRAAAAIATTAALAAAMTAAAGGTAFAATAPTHHTTTTAKLNCAANPHLCGYPDATNTGVQAGQVLTAVPGQKTSGPGWAWNASWGTLIVTGAGAVLSDLSVAGNIDVQANGVTLKNLRVTSTGNGWGIGLIHANGTLIEHCSISSPAASGPLRLADAIKDVYGDTEHTTIAYDNIWHSAVGVALSAGTVKNTYIHDLAAASGDHVDGIISLAGDPAGLTISNNTILNPLTQTDDIALFPNFGQQLNVTITGNLLAGGGYSIYGGANSAGSVPSDIIISGNRFARSYYANGGYYGTHAYTAIGVNGNTWTNNTWDDTGATIAG